MPVTLATARKTRCDARKPLVRLVSDVKVSGIEVDSEAPVNAVLTAERPITALQTVVGHRLSLLWELGISWSDVKYDAVNWGRGEQEMPELLQFQDVPGRVRKVLAQAEPNGRINDIQRALTCIEQMLAKPQYRDNYLKCFNTYLDEEPAACSDVVETFLDSNTSNRILADVLCLLGNKAERRRSEQGQVENHIDAIACYQLAYAFARYPDRLDC